MTDTSLAVRENQSLALPDDNETQRMKAQAERWLRANLLPRGIKTAEQAVQVALQGRELGLPMQAALQNIYPIQGNTMLSARLTEALLKRSGYRIVPIKVTSEAAAYRFISPQGDVFEYEVTWEEAQDSKWHLQWNRDKGQWEEKPAWRGVGGRKIMLANRCVTQGAKMFASDALLFPPTEEDSSFMVYDADDNEFVSPEEAEHRQASRARDNALTANRNGRGRRLFKETGNGNGHREPVDAEFSEPPEVAEAMGREPAGKPPAEKPAAGGLHNGDREMLAAFLKKHELEPADFFRIMSEYEGREITGLSQLPYNWPKLRRILLGWLMTNRPADPEAHWMRTNERDRARFWAIMAEEYGLSDKDVHARIPRTSAFPGDFEELVDMAANSTPEDRWQHKLPGLESAEQEALL